MNELRPLPDLIRELRAQAQQQRRQYDEQSQALESDIRRIGEEIQHLEADQKKASQQLYQLRRVIHDLDGELRETLLNQIVVHVQSGQRQLAAAIDEVLDNRETLQQQRLALLSMDPAMEMDLDDYRQFEASREKALGSAPAYYRSVLSEAHEKMRQRLWPLLEIEAKLDQLPANLEVSLPLLLAINDDNAQLFLTLPVLAGDENRQDVYTRRMNAIENAVLQSLARLASFPDWTLLDVERSQWAGFRVLTTLFDYSGGIPIEKGCQTALSALLRDSWPFQGINPLLQLTRLDWELWELGQERTGVLLVFSEREPEPAITAEKGTSSSILFTERDVTSWERPLRVVEESAWTIQCRRLRTFLMRFIVQGRIGKNGMQQEQIYSGLPLQHADALREALPALIQTGILLEEQSEQTQKPVSLNPELLLDVQDLINRDVSAIWKTLIEDRK